jgi:hypothetical protein
VLGRRQRRTWGGRPCFSGTGPGLSKYGMRDTLHPGLTMAPASVESVLAETASKHACPEPRLVDYTIVGRPASWNAFCAGGVGFNDFYGHGIVNALTAVGG